MADKLLFKQFTGQPLHERRCFDLCWALFSDSLPAAKRWGSDESTKQPFTSDPSAAFEAFRRGTLFVKGGNDGFLVMLDRWRGSFYTIKIWLGAAPLQKQKRREQWLAWWFRLVEAIPSLYGFGASEREQDAKHLVEDEDSESWVGTSVAELSEFLPGVYWVTLFGAELRGTLAIDRAAAMEGVQTKFLLPDQAVVILDDSPIPDDMTERLAREVAIAKVLGDDYFFDRERPERALRAVPAFRDAIARFESER